MFAELFHDRALVYFLDVQGQGFPRLAHFAVDGFLDDLGARNGELEALAPHVLDEDGKVQLAAPGDPEFVLLAGWLDAQRDVVEEFPLEAIAQVAAGHVLAFASGEGRIVDLEGHGDGRLVDDQRRQRLDRLGIAERIGDMQLVEAGKGDDLTGRGLFPFDLLEAVKAEYLRHPAVPRGAVGADHRHGGVASDPAALHPADADHADVAGIVEGAHLKWQRPLRVDLGRRHMIDDGLEQRFHVGPGRRRITGCPALDGGCVDHGEVQLRVGRPQAVEQVEGLIHRPLGPGARAVHLVDDDDRAQPPGQCLGGDETGLRHGAFHGVDQQEHGIDHREDALDLAPEVGMPRCVDDIDAPVPPIEGGVLGEDRNAALALEVVRIHHPFGDFAELAEGAGLAQKLVDQRRLAMIHMGDDGDVTQDVGGVVHGQGPGMWRIWH